MVPWEIKAKEFGNCNCTYGCPCQFDALPTGLYTVEVEATGFKKASLRVNEVRIGQPTTANVRLDFGNVTETVEVTGASEVVQTSTCGNYGNILTERLTCRLSERAGGTR